MKIIVDIKIKYAHLPTAAQLSLMLNIFFAQSELTPNSSRLSGSQLFPTTVFPSKGGHDPGPLALRVTILAMFFE